VAEPEGDTLINVALECATAAHISQKRKAFDDPYIVHPIRVFEMARDIGLNEEAQAAALLHDVVEDTYIMQHDLIALKFPDRTVDLVMLLTKDWKDETPEDLQAAMKVVYYSKISNDQDAASLKTLDRADNLNDMTRMLTKPEGCRIKPKDARRWAENYFKKTAREFPMVLQAASPDAVALWARAMYQLKEALYKEVGDEGHPILMPSR
jgi:(p)ppGpp synthase/HD superfamily hydrolase